MSLQGYTLTLQLVHRGDIDDYCSHERVQVDIPNLRLDKRRLPKGLDQITITTSKLGNSPIVYAVVKATTPEEMSERLTNLNQILTSSRKF